MAESKLHAEVPPDWRKVEGALDAHPAANLVPLMSDQEFATLLASIRETGFDQHEPIVTLDGRILDGRHRYKACLILGVDPKLEDYRGGTDPISLVSFVLLRNVKGRRRLTDGQIAYIGLERKKYWSVVAAEKERRRKSGDSAKSGQVDEPINAKERAAKEVGISTGAIWSAEFVESVAPDLAEEVRTGKVHLHQAEVRARARTRRESLRRVDDDPVDVFVEELVRAEGVRFAAALLQELADVLLTAPHDRLPPILDARRGIWQERKKAWRKWGLDDSIGRSGSLLQSRRTVETLKAAYRKNVAGTSLFDPVLAQTLYRWFCPPGGTVLDPFAGGPTRGVVAACAGLEYTGIDLREEQVAANRALAGDLLREHAHNFDWQMRTVPQWVVGDAGRLDSLLSTDYAADFVITCPPYWNREKYSHDSRDLSNTKTYDQFVALYQRALTQAIGRLRPNRFMAVVTGKVPKGDRPDDLQFDTIRICEDAGAALYHQAILLTPLVSTAIRAPKQAKESGRFLEYQDVTVFCKGDPEEARAALLARTERVPTSARSPVAERDARMDTDDRVSGPAVTVTPLATERAIPEEASLATAGTVTGDGLTPVERHGDVWLKRDDLYEFAGVRGGKVRTCLALARQATGGLVTAGARTSPQCLIVARVARELGLPCCVHTPSGDLGPEVAAAALAGAEVVQHRPGHNSVIVKRAKDDAAARGWTLIPFGMECEEAVRQTSRQVENLPRECTRIVIPVGSGMSLAGVLAGMKERGDDRPVLGVVVGASPVKRLDSYAPNWPERCKIEEARVDYHKEVRDSVGSVLLDSIYEAKCVPFLRPGDCLWIVGIGATRSQTATK